MWPCSVMVTVLELGDSSYCYIIEVFFSPPYFRSWYHLSCFSCIADSGLEVSSGLASQGEPVTLSVKGDLDPTLPACLPGQLDGSGERCNWLGKCVWRCTQESGC